MTLSRIAARFARCEADNRAAFVAYLMGGDPDFDTSIACFKALIESGVDILEIGAPFTDPMADGPSIQRAAIRSLTKGGSLTKTLEIARAVRAFDAEVPIVLMGYANPVHRMGYARFAEAAADAGVDGVITVDLPPEEDGELRQELSARNIAVIRLATPTTDDARMRRIADGAAGFLYYVSVTGVTGRGAGVAKDISVGVDRARKLAKLPVAIGFGVRTPEQASDFAKLSDGVVVGSALVDEVARAAEYGAPETAPDSVAVIAKSLSNAIASARISGVPH
jgi:tryptophan synthase alpha chain